MRKAVQMNDLIERQAAIEIVRKAKDKSEAHRMLIQLPSAQRWISCEERLPEAYVDVLVWFEYYRYGDYNCLYQMHGIGTYIKEYDSWIINHETGWGNLRVFAWMPLPEPEKIGGD